MVANFPLASHRGKGGTKQMNFTNLSLPMRKPISIRILQKVRTHETKENKRSGLSSKLLTPPIRWEFMSVVLFSSSNLEGLQVQVTIAAVIDFGAPCIPSTHEKVVGFASMQLGVQSVRRHVRKLSPD
jgi:hypothetical protein